MSNLTVFYDGPHSHMIRTSRDTPIFNVLWRRLLLRAQVEDSVLRGHAVPKAVWETLNELENWNV